MSDGDSNQYPASQNNAAEELHDAVASPSWLVEDRSSPEHVGIMRAMTGQKRLKVAEQMFWMARDLKAVGVRHQHPDWSEADVMAEVNRIFLHGAG